MSRYDSMSLKELTKEMERLHQALTMGHDEVASLKKEWDDVRKIHVPDKMKELGIEQARLENIGELTLRTDAVCSVSKKNMESLCQWLEGNGYGEIVSNTVDRNKLKKFIQNQIMLDKKIPEMVDYIPYQYATLKIV